MNYQTNAAGRARAILSAWDQQNEPALDQELTFVLEAASAASQRDLAEQERLDLLDGIARQMRQGFHDAGSPADMDTRTEVCLRLLRHLAGACMPEAIRPERLSFSPYLQSVRRISVCH